MFKKLLALSPFIFITACSTVGLQTVPHNGKVYYVPPNCTQYNYYDNDPDTLYCYNRGMPTGQTLRPADRQQIEAYQISRQQAKDNAEAWEKLGKSTAPKPSICYNSYGYIVPCY